MPVTIEEMEVIAAPDAPAPPAAAGAETGAADTRPAELQRALQTWAWLSAERHIRVDDR
jgi:hypothetical protein